MRIYQLELSRVHWQSSSCGRPCPSSLQAARFPPGQMTRATQSRLMHLAATAPSLSVSVVIPALNEEKYISRAIDSARSGADEIIVVDGGSTDHTVARAQAAGAEVMQSFKGRARQLNVGAAAATGQMLLFLHADSALPVRFRTVLDSAAQAQAEQTGHRIRWGCFSTIEIDAPGLSMHLLRLGVGLRTRFLHLPYGDQGIFVASDVFRRHHGFKELDLMDDVDLVLRLRRQEGPPVIIDQPVITSARRWQKLGLARTTLINHALVIAWFLGIQPDRLARWYRKAEQDRVTTSKVNGKK